MWASMVLVVMMAAVVNATFPNGVPPGVEYFNMESIPLTVFDRFLGKNKKVADVDFPTNWFVKFRLQTPPQTFEANRNMLFWGPTGTSSSYRPFAVFLQANAYNVMVRVSSAGNNNDLLVGNTVGPALQPNRVYDYYFRYIASTKKLEYYLDGVLRGDEVYSTGLTAGGLGQQPLYASMPNYDSVGTEVFSLVIGDWQETYSPTKSPTTKAPSKSPTWSPTGRPTLQPSAEPTKRPTSAPVVRTDRPTLAPTPPTVAPTPEPEKPLFEGGALYGAIGGGAVVALVGAYIVYASCCGTGSKGSDLPMDGDKKSSGKSTKSKKGRKRGDYSQYTAPAVSRVATVGSGAAPNMDNSYDNKFGAY